MSNSVVKVTDSMLNDSLLLLVGEDGTVTPDKETVETFLNSKSNPTDIQVMRINKGDGQTLDVAVDNVTYVPDSQYTVEEEAVENMDEVALSLYSVKLDHDYTPHMKPLEEIDELAKTLSFLDGHEPEPEPEPKITPKIDPPKPKPKPATPQKNNQKKEKPKPKPVQEEVSEDDDEDYSDEDYEDDQDDSDFEAEDTKAKKIKQPKPKVKTVKIKSPKATKPKEAPVVPKEPEKPQEKSPEDSKKTPKKEKKAPKPIPDDFALFSTPDIIRRVGGKDPEPTSPDAKPAKVERSKSVTEVPPSAAKPSRLSLDGKAPDKLKVEKKKPDKPKRPSVDGQTRKSGELSPVKSQASIDSTMDAASYSEDISAMIDDNKTLSSNLSLESNDMSLDQNNMALDGSGLDLDPSLLDNINNDMISEDILYQVAQSLVSNTELQNAIDKSLNEGSLVLDAAMEQEFEAKPQSNDSLEEEEYEHLNQKGTQIVRPDGRIVVIPPPERPTTRSRNKMEPKRPSTKFMHNKPLDEEHVSGNELDSSGEEEESEDDPNKLWCICNQPHNNRFMICCDTCEEWYHGKCVNITKAMGQQMESEGREWICLFCKDPHLRRPQAAARRIRKASRNSRQSSDSAGSSVPSVDVATGVVPCIVCQKPSRTNSIFCSERCILTHAQGVERVLVFERSSGNMLTGNRAPSAGNLEQWLKEHPGYEVVRSAGKVVTTKQNMTQSKLKIVKNPDNDGVSLALHKKGTNLGVLKHLPKHVKIHPKGNPPHFKIMTKNVSSTPSPKPKVTPPKIQPTPPKLKPAPPAPKLTPKEKEKPIQVKIPKVRQSEQPPIQKQENIRDNVQKTLFEQLLNRLKLVEDLKLSEEEVKSISLDVESQLYKCFGDTGQKYRNKYRSIIFNVKDIKNQTLWRRICEKSISPYQLVRLSSDDMASQELAMWREREAKHQLDMIKKSELELLSCNRQYVLKTHKGEQIVEDNRPTDAIDNSEAITSLTDGPIQEKSESKRDGSKDRDRKSSKHSHRDKDRKSSKEKSGESRHISSSKDGGRKKSHSRDRSRSGKKRSRSRDKHRKSSHKSSKHKKDSHRGSSTDKLDKKSKEILEQLVDNKIVPPLEDRLWKHVSQEDIVPNNVAESDSDHEPTSTVTIPTPPHVGEIDDYQPTPTDLKTDKFPEEKSPSDSSSSPPLRTRSGEIWKGVINMIDVAEISITAHEVSGDCAGIGTELPRRLDIVGRISPETVWDYIGKMKCSNSKVISLVRLNAVNVEEKMPYLALYSYLSSRGRLGVVKSPNKAVKDFYILPLASQKPIPQALLPISGPGFEEARPALLLGIIVRDKRKRPLLEPVTPPIVVPKKPKIDVGSAIPPRSYTPPPMKPKFPLPPSPTEDDDEPYSPEDSDPDSAVPPVSSESSAKGFLDTEPFSKKFDDIPGLGNPTLPSSTQEIQRQMEELNKEIEMQKSEINSISQNIATAAASTEIGTSALANIALPSNLQQILDSIKTIGAASGTDSSEVEPTASNPVQESADLTIPLMLPTSFSRSLNTGSDVKTIPLNLPKKKPTEADKSSVLSSLSEEDLIRKAEEMLGESKPRDTSSAKRSKLDLDQPPIPGLEDETT